MQLDIEYMHWVNSLRGLKDKEFKDIVDLKRSVNRDGN